MDGIANVARQQQSQITPHESQAKTAEKMQTIQAVMQTRMNGGDSVAQINTTKNLSDSQIDSKQDVEELVKKLNSAMAPLNPDIKFGVDQNDIFYVAAIDARTHRMIRRFPAEQAQAFLPKMQEVSGILFDSKG
jgi:flagellar protein FlaG